MSSRKIPRRPPRRGKPPERTPRSSMMTEYEHMMCDMYEEQEWREDAVAQWKQSHHWLRRLMDWIFGTSYNFVDIPDSYFEPEKPKQPAEQMNKRKRLPDNGVKTTAPKRHRRNRHLLSQHTVNHLPRHSHQTYHAEI